VPEISARPYSYAFEVPSTALVVIDMQRDFIERGGFGEALGNDVSRLAAIVPTVAALIEWSRARGIRVLHTREGHRPDLADCPPAKLRRGAPALRIGPRSQRDGSSSTASRATTSSPRAPRVPGRP
jgi:biuret amidohydrolase